MRMKSLMLAGLCVLLLGAGEARAQRGLPGQLGIGLSTGTVDGFLLRDSRLCYRYWAWLELARYNRNHGYWNFGAGYLHKDPYGPFASRQTYVRLSELGDETPLVVNRIMYTIYKRDARHIKTVGSKRFGVQLLLKDIYVQDELFYFHTSLRNLSNVDYDIDRVRFRIADRKVAKRTAVQETVIEPVCRFNEIAAVQAGGTVRNVWVFRKFTIPDDKVLIMDVFERNGGRHQRRAAVRAA